MIAKLILILHVLIAVALVGLVLIQQGKGADAGASFGSGSSQTVFGSAGSAGFLTKLTALLALVFFVTSFGLAIIAKQRDAVPDAGLPVLEQLRPADVPAEVPALPLVPPAAGAEIPAIPAQ